MGVKDLLRQKAEQAKSFVTGKKQEAEQAYEDRQLEAELRAKAREAGREVEREERGESRASQIARNTKNAIAGQFSSSFKNAVGYNKPTPQPAKVGKMKRLPDNVNKNIPRTRVPIEPPKPSFINRQIDLSYNPGQGYTSNVVNEAFRFKQFEDKPQKAIGGLPTLRGTFEQAVGYKAPKEKKPAAYKFTITIQRKKKQ